MVIIFPNEGWLQLRIGIEHINYQRWGYIMNIDQNGLLRNNLPFVCVRKNLFRLYVAKSQFHFSIALFGTPNLILHTILYLDTEYNKL